jgi:hypothetical protein
MRHGVTKVANGTIMQAAIPKGRMPDRPMNANGLFLRGVVTATYVEDDPTHPAKVADPAVTPRSVYCDVFCYSDMPGVRSQFVPGAMVLPIWGNMHNGVVWKPRATTMDVTGAPVDFDKGFELGNLDGDHVLVGFFENTWNRPFILCGIPHPQNDLGNTSKTIGHRKGLKVTDGDPMFLKHHGALFGVTDAGDFEVDTTAAYPGTAQWVQGQEPTPTGGPATGNYRVKIPPNSVLEVLIDGGATFKVAFKDALATMTVGDGSKSVVIAQNLQTWLDGTMKTWMTAHTHPTGMGPSGPPVEAPTYPAYDTLATSTKVKIPNG